MPNTSRQSTSGPFECPICHKNYTIRSSYIRHSKQCLERTVSAPRRKSCRQCVVAKTRCDNKQPSCSRCALRNDPCEYAQVTSRQRTGSAALGAIYEQSSNLDERLEDIPNSEFGLADYVPSNGISSQWPNQPPSPRVKYAPVTPSCSNPRSPEASGTIDHNQRLPHYALADVLAPIGPLRSSIPATVQTSPLATGDVGPLRDRWLYPFRDMSPAKHVVRRQSMAFLSRIFRTWPRMMTRREHLPPFIHPTQMSGESIAHPLANCITLCRMWGGDDQCDGNGGVGLVESTIRQEVKKLLDEYRTYNSNTLLAAFQSLLLYSIILLFPKPQKPSPLTFEIALLVNLQEVGYHISQSDLVLSSELAHKRPAYQDWIMMCCKRRTLMSLYCFEWIYAMLNDLSTFPCTEIGFLPAPAGKQIWAARTEKEWESAYDRWLGRWAGKGAYKLAELGTVKPGTELDARTEMWLEEADEFGVMYMALVNAAEGEIADD